MRKLKRLLAFSLALVTLFFALSPSLAQPVQAVAAIDDAVLAVGLLFMTWSGITFSSNTDCYKAVSNFLSNSVAGLEACTNVASNYLTENGLALVTDVQDAYSSVLSDIQKTFQTPAGSTSGAISGSLPVGVPISVPIYDSDSSDLNSCLIPSSQSSTGNTYYFIDSSGIEFSMYPVFNSREIVFYKNGDRYSSFTFPSAYSVNSFGFYILDGILHARFNVNYSGNKYIFDQKYSSLTCSSGSVTLSDVDSISFSKTKEIEDTEILEVTFAPGGVWEPSPDDPTEPSQPLIPFLPFDPFQNPITWGQDTSLGLDSPGLNPSTVLQDLKQLLDDFLNGSGIGGSGGSGGSTGTDTQGGDLGQKYDADWKGVFPFCVPFDLIDFLSILSATPQAPKFTWRFYVPRVVDYNIEIDLSPFDSVAEIVRTMELLAFCIGLILLTRNIIRG